MIADPMLVMNGGFARVKCISPSESAEFAEFAEFAVFSCIFSNLGNCKEIYLKARECIAL